MRCYLEQGLGICDRPGSRDQPQDRLQLDQAGELERDPDDLTLRYGPRLPVPSKLDPYKEKIRVKLAKFPQLTAARLFREVKADGYVGGYGTVKRYVRQLKEKTLTNPRETNPR